ncbi:MAG TPA: hypothetical protein VNO31_13150, partial [Umezawaea sp.]|nr:hypothetical protein [Umezawaea sp.]
MTPLAKMPTTVIVVSFHTIALPPGLLPHVPSRQASDLRRKLGSGSFETVDNHPACGQFAILEPESS